MTQFSAASIGGSSTDVPTYITPADGPGVDAFGLQRTTGKPGNRFDVEFLYDKQPELVDEVLTGAGTSTYNTNSRDITLGVGGSAVDDGAALYGYDVPYTPGSSQLIEITAAMDEAAIGVGLAQIFIRSSVTGTVVETTYDQADWSLNAVPDVDWSKSQIFAMDFQSLKVGRIRFALVRDGAQVPVHTISNDNIRTGGYWQLANQPPYWRIYNTALYSIAEVGYGDANNGIGFRYLMPAQAGATMRAICCTVKSEGGVSLLDMPGFIRTADSYTTAKTVSTTFIPILSLRVASTFPTTGSQPNKGLYIPLSYTIQTNNPIYYRLLYRPTLTNPSFTPIGATISGLEYDVSATAISGGIPIESGYVSTDRNAVGGVSGLLNRTLMKLGRTGTSDILTLAAIRTGTVDGVTYSAIRCKEIR